MLFNYVLLQWDPLKCNENIEFLTNNWLSMVTFIYRTWSHRLETKIIQKTARESEYKADDFKSELKMLILYFHGDKIETYKIKSSDLFIKKRILIGTWIRVEFSHFNYHLRILYGPQVHQTVLLCNKFENVFTHTENNTINTKIETCIDHGHS